MSGRLVVVGTGIRAAGQLTIEAIAAMKSADELLYLVTDPGTEAIVADLNPGHAESLRGFYEDGKERRTTYAEIVERILSSVREGKRVCAAFYGHPGVFVLPSHRAVRQARKEGFEARMLPAVSAEDCLFADLGVDPADAGCQTYEATDFLLNHKVVEPSASLILWQIGILADWSYQRAGYSTQAVPLLLERLSQTYPLSHVGTLYEAEQYPGQEPMIHRLALWQLAHAPIRPMMTLFIPPAMAPRVDHRMWGRLGAMGIGPGARD